MNDNLIINRVSILRKGQETKTYLLPSITDLLTDGLIKKNHIDWESVKQYLDGLYESKTAHNADINSINNRLITLSIDNEGNLEYSGYKFLNVINYNPTNTEGLTNRVTTLEGNVSSLYGSINTINTTLQGLPSTYANKNHTHSFSELTGISEDNGYLNIGTNGNKFVEILSSKLIELNASPVGNGKVYITPVIRSGEKAILVAEPDDGYEFVNWSYNNYPISNNAIHILDNPSSDATYYGTFTIKGSDTPEPTSFTITISEPTQGSIVATANGRTLGYGTSELTQGTIVHLEVSAYTGYEFTGWVGVPTGKENLQSLSFAIESSTVISASFRALTYTVTVGVATDANNTPVGTGNYPVIKINGVVQSNPVTVNYNTSVTLEAAASIGNYDFTRWSDNRSTNRVRTQNIIDNLTTHPIYTRPTYTVTFSSNSAQGTITATYKDTGVAILSGESVLKGFHITFTATPANGYELDSWSGIPSGSTYDDVVVNSALNISATFKEVTPVYTPTIRVYFGEVINKWTKFEDNVIVRYISQQQLTNPYEVQELVNLDGRELSVEGYEFVQWEEDDHIAIEGNNLSRSTTSEDLTFYGTFAKRITTYVTTEDSTKGSVSGGGTYLAGDIISISATANEGYHFVKWSDNNTQNPRTVTVNENTTTYTAVFAINTYEVTTSVEPLNSGTISGLNSPYDWNTTCNITATPATGYDFVNWTEGGQTVSSNATYEFVVKANHTLVTVFAKKSYTITTTSTTGGSASPVSQTVEHGTSVTVTAIPDTSNGYKFTKWTKGTSTTSVSTDTEYTFTATSQLTLKANFEKENYTVSASVDPTGSGTVTVGGTANSKSISHGSATTLVATPSSGYEFVNWTLNGTQVATTASYTTPAITTATSYVAHFSEVNNTIYYFASENDDYSPTGKTVKTLGDNNNTEQLNNVDTLVFLVPTTITITKIEDAQIGTDFFNKFQTHAVTYNNQEYTAYYYTDPNAYINGQFIVRQ